MYPFNTFSADMLNHLLPGQRSMQDTLTATEKESVSAAGAISVTTRITELSVTGTVAYTLADGPAGIAGMRKTIRCVAAASTPLGTVTIASPETATGFVCSSTFTFTAVGQELELEWTGTKWRALRVKRAGTQAVVVGTTVLTGLNLALNYVTSVTATVSSTGTKSIPNGSAVGEVCVVSCGTAASTPVGNINFTGYSLIGAAATDIQAIGATTDCALLCWDGQGWHVLPGTTGVTIA